MILIFSFPHVFVIFFKTRESCDLPRTLIFSFPHVFVIFLKTRESCDLPPNQIFSFPYVFVESHSPNQIFSFPQVFVISLKRRESLSPPDFFCFPRFLCEHGAVLLCSLGDCLFFFALASEASLVKIFVLVQDRKVVVFQQFWMKLFFSFKASLFGDGVQDCWELTCSENSLRGKLLIL